MTTTKPPSPSVSATPAVDELFEDVVPVIDTVYVAGPPLLLLWAGTVLLALMLAGPFALLVTLVLVLAAAAAVVALVGAILAAPYLLVRHLRGRRVARTMTSPALRLASAQSQRVAA